MLLIAQMIPAVRLLWNRRPMLEKLGGASRDRTDDLIVASDAGHQHKHRCVSNLLNRLLHYWSNKFRGAVRQSGSLLSKSEVSMVNEHKWRCYANRAALLACSLYFSDGQVSLLIGSGRILWVCHNPCWTVEISTLEAVRNLFPLAHTDGIADEPDRRLIIGILSETDHPPVGEVRKRWAAEALREKDVEIARAEARWKADFLLACKRIAKRAIAG